MQHKLTTVIRQSNNFCSWRLHLSTRTQSIFKVLSFVQLKFLMNLSKAIRTPTWNICCRSSYIICIWLGPASWSGHNSASLRGRRLHRTVHSTVLVTKFSTNQKVHDYFAADVTRTRDNLRWCYHVKTCLDTWTGLSPAARLPSRFICLTGLKQVCYLL